MPIVVSLDGLLIQTSRLAFFAFAIGTITLVNWLGKRRHVEDGVLGGLVERMFFVGVIGARIAYVAEHFSAYGSHRLSAFYIWQSGYAPWAGFAAGAMYLGWVAWRRRIPLTQTGLIGIISLPMAFFYWLVLTTLGQFAPADRLHPGSALPNLLFANLNGQQVDLAELRGRPAVINIWATWCLPCREEMPLLSRTFGKLRAGSFALVGVDLAEPARRVKRFLYQTPIRYPVWVDPSTVIGQKVRSPSTNLFDRAGGFAVPTTLFVNGKGVIKSIYVGKLTAAILAIKLGDIGVQPPGDGSDPARAGSG